MTAMPILALETSTELGTCALLIGDQCLERTCPAGRPHSETLLPLIRELLAEAGLTFSQLAGIAFGVGPGAFTGLRVACGVAQGLATAADLPLVPVCSLENLAEQSGQDAVLSILDARMGEVYVAAYQRQAGTYRQQGDIQVVPPQAVPVPEGSGWLAVGNALAVGLSQGFVEPLEATALHVVQTTVEQFLDAWEDQERDAFNAEIAARLEGIRDYIVCHYRMNRRTGTNYWRENAANQNLSDSLKAILSCWFTGGDLSAEIAEQGIARFYAPLSWHCLLAGYGTFPEDARLVPPGSDIETFDLTRIDAFMRHAATDFADHKALLDRMAA